MNTPTEENGWQIIVPADHSKFLPNISTDEHWHNGDWSDCINNGLFSDNVTYRRRIATPKTRPRLTKWLCPKCGWKFDARFDMCNECGHESEEGPTEVFEDSPSQSRNAKAREMIDSTIQELEKEEFGKCETANFLRNLKTVLGE